MFIFRAGIDRPVMVDGIKLFDRANPAYRCRGEAGTFVTPIYNPVLGAGYEGFDTTPRENTTVAIIKPGVGFHRFQSGAWQPFPTPTYYSPEEMRGMIGSWTGAVQFQIKITRGNLFRELALGCNVPLDILTYLIKFRLPELLSRPIAFHLPARTTATGTLTLPNYSQIANIQIKLISSNVIIPFTRTNDTLATTAPNQLVYLSFTSTPKVSILDFTPHQISAVPEILVQPKSERNVRRSTMADWLETPAQNRITSVTYSADQPFEIGVVAENLLDARSICQQLICRIQSIGHLVSPADDRRYPIQVMTGVTNKPNLGALTNSAIASFDVCIPQYAIVNQSSQPKHPA
jgi:hypothetical protein